MLGTKNTVKVLLVKTYLSTRCVHTVAVGDEFDKYERQETLGSDAESAVYQRSTKPSPPHVIRMGYEDVCDLHQRHYPETRKQDAL